MIVRYQIIQRRPMRIDLAPLRNPKAWRATTLRLRPLLFGQIFKQAFVGHRHHSEAVSPTERIIPVQPSQMAKYKKIHKL
jgi:hypothetical protein